jgi:hypothetical protein
MRVRLPRAAVRALSLLSIGAALGLLVAAAALVTAAATTGVFVTRPGAWTTTVAPLRGLPSLALTVNVPGVARLALSPLGQRLLDGRATRTRIGTLHFRRHGRTLVVDCAPCRIDDARLAPVPVELPLEVRLTPRADADAGAHVEGMLRSEALVASLRATLAATHIDIAWSLPPADVAAVVRRLAAAIPESRVVQVDGRIAAEGTLRLPELRARSQLQVDGLAVDGLGTETLGYGLFEQACTAADGSVVRVLNGPGSRFWLDLDAMGDRLPAAVLAAEDQRFFSHAGFDAEEIAAALADFDARGPAAATSPAPALRGASTLTQQLARTLFTGGDRSAVRKLRELLYAVEMERTLGKQRVLELYLNTVDWGPGLCGARAAARTYFRKSPAQLSALETAWLAASLRHPRRAYEREFLTGRADLARTHAVLAQMRSLPPGERTRAARTSLAFAPVPKGARAAAAVAAR